MGSSRNLIWSYKLHHFSISFLFLMISSWTQLRLIAEGRAIFKPDGHYQVQGGKAIQRGQIGSRPPQCESICRSCGHCEAIQVPTNPQTATGCRNSSSTPRIDYARGDDSSNYKPMSWKCKCGNLIFNP